MTAQSLQQERTTPVRSPHRTAGRSVVKPAPTTGATGPITPDTRVPAPRVSPATRSKNRRDTKYQTPQADPELVAASLPDTDGPVWVTPEIATLWLSRNTANRPVRDARVLAFARDMANGDWPYTGEAIKFDTEGNLIDGQHRLFAIIEANVTVKLLVLFGLDRSAQQYLDAGIKRTVADALTFRGEINTSLLASCARVGIQADHNNWNHKNTLTTAEVIDWITNHPDIRRHVHIVGSASAKIDISPTVFTYASWRLSQISPAEAAAFVSDVIDMRSLGAGDPINTLLQRFRSARKGREKLDHRTQLLFVYRTWNALRTGTRLQQLKVPAGSWALIEPR